MDENMRTETLKIREPYDPMFRAMFLVSAVIILAIIGFGFTDAFDPKRSSLERVGVSVAILFGIASAYVLWRLDLELRINSERVRARAWPLRSTVVPIDQITHTEIVTIDPLGDYGGWGLKGTKRDKLIGGGGTTALRITYLHESGEERKITFLTDRAEETEQRITAERTR